MASSTRTIGRRGLASVSTLQTPWPPLPRSRLITRGPAASRAGNSTRIASAVRYELCTDGVEDIVLVDHRFRIDADIGERHEHGLEPAGVCRGTTARRFIAAP